MKKLFLTIIMCLFIVFDTNAKTIIRDAEIEQYIRDYSEDIFKSAGLNPDMVKIVLIRDDSANAFVAGGMNIFIHTGLIEMCDTPEELIGIIAHETGHISGGHLARLGEEIESSKMNALYSLLLATVAGVGSGSAEVGSAIFASTNELNKRNYLHYSRIQESIADQNAFKFLNRSKISSQGLLTFLNKLERQSLLPESSQAEYLSTHPLSKNRIKAVESHLENYNLELKKIDVTKFNIIKEKIMAFDKPRRVISKYKNSEKLYPLAIAEYRIGNTNKSLNIIDSLIEENYKNPYLYELKGQILRENGEIQESIKAYKKANSLISSPLIKIDYAKAMLDSNNKQYLNDSITNLNQALQIEKQSIIGWRLLAKAYDKNNNKGLSRLAQAEADLLIYDIPKAKFNAEKAKEILENEKKSCQRCLDIVEFIEQKNKEGETK